MIDRLLESHLRPIARGCHRWMLWRQLTYCWAAFAAAALAAILAHRYFGWYSPGVFFLLIFGAILAAVIIVRRFGRNPMDFRGIARQIEEQNPELHALLLTAVEQVPLEPGGELNYLQQRVIAEALEHHRRSPWGARVARRYSAAVRAQWLMLLLFVLGLMPLRPEFSGPKSFWASAERSGGVTVAPGDITLERGSGLVVLAKFDGRLPAEARLVVTPVNEPETVIPLAKNLSDPVFGGGMPSVKTDLKYHIEYSSSRTREFKVTVFDYPKLEHADAKVTYPAYTGLSEKTVKDTRRISAVEGSSLDYSFFLNKPVVKAELVGKDKSVVPLSAETNNATIYRTKIDLDQSRRYELVLVDDAGRTNKVPPEFVLDALKNRAAQLHIASPRGDQRVSALEEISFQADATGDYGLKAFGIAYSLAGGDTKVVQIGQQTTAREKKQFNYLLPLEDLKAEPDQLLSYYIWADDTGSDGQLRHNVSDMYFAEIRPFDEIFREGQQMDQGEQQNQNQNGQNGQGNQNDRLSELQKQIVTATWNLKRRETGAKPTDKYKDDITVIRDSQQQALEQVQSVKEQTDDPRMQGFADAAEKAMEKATKDLTEAVDKNSLTPLPPALTNEQAAYQALLRLSAREFQVTRGQRGQRGGQQQRGGQRMQRQLDQLDLQQNANRYETQRQAAAQNTPQQREQLQVANRLKELAQRQQDLNDRLRELQTALQEARTQQERDDLRDRLKRLREEQQDLLADVDELRQRMDRPENQTDMSQERQQLDQTRSQVQQAAESLGQDSVPDALASGTRAQRELQQLQDDVRRKSSGQFAEDMRRMRDEARQLADKQENIDKKLNEMADPQQKTLSETDEQRKARTDLANQLLQQKDAITNLFNQMKEVSEQSENTEPLLSEQLYDTIRRTERDKLDQSLDQSSELVRRGFLSQAVPQVQPANTNIDSIHRSVEHAAESILGDGTEALRLARAELDELNRQLAEGPAREGDTNALGQALASGRRSGNRGQRGDPQQADNQNGENQVERDANAQANAGNRGERGQRDGRGDQQANNQANGGGGRDGEPQDAQGQRSGGQRGGQRGGRGGQRGQPGELAANDTQNADEANGGGGGGTNRVGGVRDVRGGARVGVNNNYGGGGYWGGAYWDTLFGADYTDWTDRLRDAEEMIDVPDLRTQVAQIRDRARVLRNEYKKTGVKPDWAVLNEKIVAPLAEVRTHVNEELLRRESKDALVPLDRDPVPSKFSELVRRYYEQLGKSDE